MPANVGDAGLTPESGISPGEGNGNPVQYSCPDFPPSYSPGGHKELGNAEQQQQSGLKSKEYTFILYIST